MVLIFQGINAELCNFGRANFNLGNMYAYQELFVKQFQADMALFFIAGNDLSFNYDDPALPKVFVDSANEIELNICSDPDYLRQFKVINILTSHSRILYMLNKARRQFSVKETLFEGKFDFGESSLTAKVDTFVLTQEAKVVLTKLAKQSCIIVWRDYYAMPQVLSEFLSDLKMDCIDLSPVLISLKQSGIEPYYWKASQSYGHWNNTTHKEIGLYLGEKIIPLFHSLLSQQCIESSPVDTIR